MRLKSFCHAVAVLFFLATGTLCGQDHSSLTQFFVNPASINPSYTGIDGRASMFLSYRKQWAGFDGSPSLMGLSLQAPLPAQVLAGLSVYNDKRGLINTSSILFTGGYSVHLDNARFLRFGLSIGGAWNKVDINSLVYNKGQVDNAISNLASNNFEALGNAGVSFHTKTVHIGASIPNIFERTVVSEEAFTFSVSPFQSILFNVSNRFYFGDGMNVFEPYLVYRLNSDLPSQFEFASILHLQNKVWLGGSYKQDFGISALAGLKLGKLSSLGYSYTIKNSGDNEIPFPSHELQLSFLFGKHNTKLQAYSFIDTHIEKVKKTPHELALERQKKQEELARKKAAETKPPVKKEETVVKKEEPVVTKTDTSSHKAGPRMRTGTDPIADVPEHERDQHIEEQEKIKRLEEHAEDPTAHHELPDTLHAHAERHEFVKRGTHTDEMGLADYVIIGAFRAKPNAEHFANGLKSMGFPQTDYGFISVRNLWYVYIASGNDINQVKAERDKYRRMKMFKDAWLLTVHE